MEEVVDVLIVKQRETIPLDVKRRSSDNHKLDTEDPADSHNAAPC